MDYDKLKVSARRLIGDLLPMDFVASVAAAIFAHKDVLVRNFPEIVEELKPHFRSGMVEAGAGIFDADELEAKVFEFLAELGLSPAMLAQLQDAPEADPPKAAG